MMYNGWAKGGREISFFIAQHHHIPIIRFFSSLPAYLPPIHATTPQQPPETDFPVLFSNSLSLSPLFLYTTCTRLYIYFFSPQGRDYTRAFSFPCYNRRMYTQKSFLKILVDLNDLKYFSSAIIRRSLTSLGQKVQPIVCVCDDAGEKRDIEPTTLTAITGRLCMYKRNLFCLILYPFHCWDDDVWALGREQSSICHRFQLSAIQGQEQNGAERRKRRRRRIVIVGDDRAELYTSDAAMANETRVKEETQQLKSFWQTTMRRRRKVEVSNGHTTAEKRDRDVLIKDAQSRAAPPQSSWWWAFRSMPQQWRRQDQKAICEESI